MSGALAVKRGCGTRHSDAVYLECGACDGGRPLSELLKDPPLRVPDGWDVPNRGVKLVQHNGITHVVDRVGEGNYPNVLDFVLEISFGLSRRLPANLDFSKLTQDSRIIMIHPRAIVENWPIDATRKCPTCRMHTVGEVPPCIGVWWETVTGGKPVGPVAESSEWQREFMPPSIGGIIELGLGGYYRGGDPERIVHRVMPSFSYYARRAPDGFKPEFTDGIFIGLPISRLAIVKGRKTGELQDRVGKSKIDVEVVDR